MMFCSLILLQILGCVLAGTDYRVSSSGTDMPGCGSPRSTPCRTAIPALPRMVSGNTLLLDATPSPMDTKPPLHGICFGDGLIIDKGISIKSYNGRARLGCDSETSEKTIFVIDQTEGQEAIVIENLAFQGGRIVIKGGTVDIRNSTFTNVMFDSRNCNSASVSMSNVYFDRTQTWTAPFGNLLDSSISCNTLTATVTGSSFYDLNMHFKGTVSNHVVIKDCLFSKKLMIESDIGGINVTLPYSFGYLEVKDCVFERQVHLDPVYSIINIESSALRIDARDFIGGWLPNESNATVFIHNCIFRNNERAISISRRYKHVLVDNCVFDSNVAMHAGAAIRMAMDPHIRIRVTNCVFTNNAAGFNTHEAVPGIFEFRGDEVRISNGPINGVISLVGKGGAVRVQKGLASFDNCTFTNNTARLLGGSIFVDRESTAIVENSRFENAGDSKMHSMQGDILYSSGSVRLRDVKVEILTAHDHVSVLRHGGDYWSMNVESLWFRCPLGHRLVMMNTTSHKIESDTGLLRSYKLDQLYYYCQICGNNHYSVDRGYVNYTVTERNAEYYTLMINGEEPFQSHPVSFDFGNITCRDCPYGARCENKLKVIANFWGYQTGNRLVFQHCPPEYCCSEPTCPSYDACAPHRTGRLCGRCKEGFSEALFSSTCISDELCQNNWIYPVLACMGLLYCLFLLYQKDMRDFLSNWSLEWRVLLCCFRKRSYAVTYSKRKAKETEGKSNMECLMKEKKYLEPDLKQGISRHCGASEVKSPSDEGSHPPDAAFLIILFYYFQDALLLHIDTIYTKTTSKFEKQIKEFLVGLFRFRLDFFQFLDDICLYAGLQPVPKCLLKTLFVPYVVMFFGLAYVAHRIYRKFAGGSPSHFMDRLSGGFILAMLFTYQKLATTTFTLLNCVPVADVSVLFIDGTQTCFQGWQYLVMGYAFTSVLPFSIILMVGPPLLKQQRISLSQFFFGCLCPLPALVHWLVRYQQKTRDEVIPITSAANTVIQVLQGPFKDTKSRRLIHQLCWAGVLLGRRLVLFLCYTFINDVLIRLLCMMGVCFIILMHHMYVRPYKMGTGNLSGAFSAGALLVVGAINLMRAAFEAAEYIPMGPYKLLMEVCEELENTLLLWLPLAGICLIFVTIVAKAGHMLKHRFCSSADTQSLEIPMDEPETPLTITKS